MQLANNFQTQLTSQSTEQKGLESRQKTRTHMQNKSHLFIQGNYSTKLQQNQIEQLKQIKKQQRLSIKPQSLTSALEFFNLKYYSQSTKHQTSNSIKFEDFKDDHMQKINTTKGQIPLDIQLMSSKLKKEVIDNDEQFRITYIDNLIKPESKAVVKENLKTELSVDIKTLNAIDQHLYTEIDKKESETLQIITNQPKISDDQIKKQSILVNIPQTLIAESNGDNDQISFEQSTSKLQINLHDQQVKLQDTSNKQKQDFQNIKLLENLQEISKLLNNQPNINQQQQQQQQLAQKQRMSVSQIGFKSFQKQKVNDYQSPYLFERKITRQTIQLPDLALSMIYLRKKNNQHSIEKQIQQAVIKPQEQKTDGNTISNIISPKSTNITTKQIIYSQMQSTANPLNQDRGQVQTKQNNNILSQSAVNMTKQIPNLNLSKKGLIQHKVELNQQDQTENPQQIQKTQLSGEDQYIKNKKQHSRKNPLTQSDQYFYITDKLKEQIISNNSSEYYEQKQRQITDFRFKLQKNQVEQIVNHLKKEIKSDIDFIFRLSENYTNLDQYLAQIQQILEFCFIKSDQTEMENITLRLPESQLQYTYEKLISIMKQYKVSKEQFQLFEKIFNHFYNQMIRKGFLFEIGGILSLKSIITETLDQLIEKKIIQGYMNSNIDNLVSFSQVLLDGEGNKCLNQLINFLSKNQVTEYQFAITKITIFEIIMNKKVCNINYLMKIIEKYEKLRFLIFNQTFFSKINICKLQQEFFKDNSFKIYFYEAERTKVDRFVELLLQTFYGQMKLNSFLFILVSLFVRHTDIYFFNNLQDKLINLIQQQQTLDDMNKQILIKDVQIKIFKIKSIFNMEDKTNQKIIPIGQVSIIIQKLQLWITEQIKRKQQPKDAVPNELFNLTLIQYLLTFTSANFEVYSYFDINSILEIYSIKSSVVDFWLQGLRSILLISNIEMEKVDKYIDFLNFQIYYQQQQ